MYQAGRHPQSVGGAPGGTTGPLGLYRPRPLVMKVSPLPSHHR